MKKRTTFVGLICFVIFLVTSSLADQFPLPDKRDLKKDEVWVCDRWQWVGDPIDNRVVCISWVKKDCSNRLYKEICKMGNQP